MEKKLIVTTTSDKPEYHPGDTVEVRVHVKSQNGSGARAEVTLSVADLGVLNLIGYRLPKMFDAFYAERGLSVVTTETRMHLVEQRNYDEKGEPAGGGGADERTYAPIDADGLRKDFRSTAYWNPTLLTDEQGLAVVRFKLPDNITGFEMMAVAHTMESDFGYGENSFNVNKPLLLQPAFPRFVRVGDQFEAGAFVFNYSDKERSVRLVSSVKGVDIVSSDTTDHVLKPGQALEVRRQYRANVLGKAVFSFKAYSGTERDGFQWTIPVQMPRLRETVALSESTTEPSTREAIQIPADIYPELGNVEFTVSSTALVGLSNGMSYLFTYPYGCIEQRISAVLPIILAKDLVQAFKFEFFKDKDAQSVAQKTIDELPAFQTGDGGFSYWKHGERSFPYASAYAMYAAVQAKRAGYNVDKEMMKDGFSHIHKLLSEDKPFSMYTGGVSHCTRALILYTLALNGTPEYGYMENLYKQRQSLPLFARAYLLKALNLVHGDTKMIENLAIELMNMAKISATSAHFEERTGNGLEWIWSSTARTTALVMQALVETRPQNQLIPKTVRWLLDERRSGRWRTTQENMYVVDALATYFRTYEDIEPNFYTEILLAGHLVLNDFFLGRSMRTLQADTALSDLQRNKQYPVEIKKKGAGRLYYGIRMNYYPKGITPAKEEGLTVLKSIEYADDRAPVGDTIKAASTVRVTLTLVSNQARNYIVLNDPVPAGLEPINTSFTTTAQTGSQNKKSRSSDDDEWDWSPFNHSEQRDDCVLVFSDYLPAGVHTFTYLARAMSFGTFSLPATKAEGMYEPEVFGQTASATVTVK
jgi:uncharacterized protein YfaS (alpha-2-macroglobulin family)